MQIMQFQWSIECQLHAIAHSWWKPCHLEKQEAKLVAWSSIKAELRAMAQGICEIFWIKILPNDLKIKCEGPVKLFCHDKLAI